MMFEILSYLVHYILALGIIGILFGFFASKIPVISNYGLLIKSVSIFVVCISLFFEGKFANEKKWRAEIARLEEAVKVAEAKSSEENVRIETKVVERIKYVKGKTEVVVARVPIYLTKEVDAKYPVPNAFVVLHDSAARSEVPPSAGSAYEGTSDVKISEVTRTVAENYGTCNEVRQQLLGWQDWYRKQRKIYESIK